MNGSTIGIESRWNIAPAMQYARHFDTGVAFRDCKSDSFRGGSTNEAGCGGEEKPNPQ
jgi:hypothetical protein